MGRALALKPITSQRVVPDMWLTCAKALSRRPSKSPQSALGKALDHRSNMSRYTTLMNRIVRRLRMIAARNLGAEILEGIREIKREEIGRVVTYPPVVEVLPQSESARLRRNSIATSRERV